MSFSDTEHDTRRSLPGERLRRCGRPTDGERVALASVLNRLCGEMTQDERQALIGLLERMGKPTESE